MVSRRRRTRRTAKRRTTSKKGAFGGYKVCFRGHTDSLEKIFGTRPLAPSAMTKKLWNYVKRKRLSQR